ncbi:murein transglycosylase [Beijerinckiaceae bacterium]|nr:murein transglycosylase [Beijerinckiaceae bacterium]
MTASTPASPGAAVSQSFAGLPPSLTPLALADLDGFGQDDLAEAFQVFAVSARAIAQRKTPLRQGIALSPALKAIGHAALTEEIKTSQQARRFFETHFRPYRVAGDSPDANAGFFTGYYEPFVEGSLNPSPVFTAPILGRPENLPVPAPERAAIEAGALAPHAKPIVWLRDPVEVFLIQVQGSARVRLEDGRVLRLVYAGRNGHPYISIGRILIETGEIAASDMSLANLKQWIRAHGQTPKELGGALMQRNKSYVFFALGADLDPAAGPIGGEGLPLTPLRSIAVDRAIWSYGMPVWIAAELPWQSSCPSPFRRLMIAQDTGSAIVGPGRADIFFGAGDDAGARAGDIRHRGDFIVLLPSQEEFGR